MRIEKKFRFIRDINTPFLFKLDIVDLSVCYESSVKLIVFNRGFYARVRVGR